MPFRPLVCTLIIVATTPVLLCCAQGEACADDWWGADKAKHLGVGLALGAASHGGLRLLDRGREARATRLLLSCLMASLPGLAKEIYDDGQPGNAFSGKDLFWSTTGALIGNGLVLGLELLLERLGVIGGPARTAMYTGL